MSIQKPLHKRRRTTAVRAGVGTDPAYRSVMPPLYLSSTFQIDGLDKRGDYEYSRTRNPTRDELANALAALEGGIGCAVTASGMAALTLLLHLLGPDDLVLAPYDMYGRSYWLLRALAEKKHFRLKFIDCYDEGALTQAFDKNPRMVILETPSNPVMRIADIADISKRAKACGALTVCDNTFLSPILQNPLKLGADIVFHSTTKFLNGHSDVVGGCVIVKDDEQFLADLHLWNNSLGTIGAPFDAYMTLRGMRTLEVRVHRGEENAAAIAHYLQEHSKVSKVFYPGLPGHEGHEIAKRQQEGFGAMLSFTLEGDMDGFLSKLEMFSLAQSLGGTESLINHPASMTHVSMGAEARAKAGVTDNLLRLSVGIEHIDDLLSDLEAALNVA
ncbi:MAG TPA: cystathionine gamma-synthase [Alphaproteobacteria bacterium]|nr:cystathionine gamma-synthase [Alphaproteobacteria bacterium]USO04749.1 MAG: cystathionine gamma-synthase [Rhodospirillales bacterium]HOO81261.1 cystathionine gamma-synthase [Alphaproteobacteria bacterium]